MTRASKPRDPSTLVVTLRSNAYGLLAGGPVNAIRRKLKLASLFYDQVLLEEGTMHVQAGPHGSTAMWIPTGPNDPVPRWQTSLHRRQARESPFTFLVGAETTPGVAAERMVPLISSDTSIHWVGTLEPFKEELGAASAWVDFVVAPPMTSELRSLARRWRSLDERNGVLSKTFPHDFVRRRVIEDTNHDLALVVGARAAMTADTLHGAVLTGRLHDDRGWSQQGFAVPLLVPRVGRLGWGDIATIRSYRAIEALRRTWQEVEDEALAEALGGGDLERAVHRAYERKLRDVAEKVGGLGGVGIDVGVGLLLSGAGGVAGAVLGPAGAVAGIVGPTAITGAIAAKRVIGQRSARRWVGLDTRIRRLAGEPSA